MVAAPYELWPLVERTLPGEVRARLDGLVGPGLEHAPAKDIARAAAAILARAEHEERGRRACSTTTAPSLRCERIDATPTRARYTSGPMLRTTRPAHSRPVGHGRGEVIHMRCDDDHGVIELEG